MHHFHNLCQQYLLVPYLHFGLRTNDETAITLGFPTSATVKLGRSLARLFAWAQSRAVVTGALMLLVRSLVVGTW